jgi:16S rRNA (adenine1518-N6/adenine1519-N6)-dimethyltransferase
MAAPQPKLPPLRDVIALYKLSARRALGQHYLLDLNITDRLVRIAGDLTQTHVIEIGPGPGGLTRSLLNAGAAHVTAIERDDRCIPALQELQTAYPNRLTIIEDDALKINPIDVSEAPRQIIANLPYNIATPLLIGWLRQASEWRGFVLMLQKEVADRITSAPGLKTYGRLSVLVQWLCSAKSEFNVNKQAFVPPPKVMSSVISLKPHDQPEQNVSWKALETVTQAAFGQRRKMLRSSIKPLGLDIESLNIDPTLRAEDLTVSDYCRLARAYTDSVQHKK